MPHIEHIAHDQKYFCYYCAHRMYRHSHTPGVPTPRDAITKDHIEPRVYGGPTTLENLVAACCQCNNLRGEIAAETFYNLLQKWFKRDPILWIRWHSIDTDTLHHLKLKCLVTYEAQLRGLGRRHRDMAYRHYEFTWRERTQLARAR